MTKKLIKIFLFSVVVSIIFLFTVGNVAYALDSNCNGIDDDFDGQCDEDFIANTICDGPSDTDLCQEGILQCPKVCDGVGGVYCDDYTDSTIENCYDCGVDSDCDGWADNGDSDCASIEYCTEYPNYHGDVDSASCVMDQSNNYGSHCEENNLVTVSVVSGICTCSSNPICLARKATTCLYGCEGDWPNSYCKSASNNPPSCPTTYTPLSGTTNVLLDQDISWSGASDLEGDLLSYDVYFGTVSPGAFKQNQTATNYNPGALIANTTYYWKVKVKDGVNTTDCLVQNFTTGSDTVADGSPCSVDSECSSTNCVLDYDSVGKICAPANQCQHNGGYYAVGSSLGGNSCIDCAGNTARWVSNTGRFIIKQKSGSNKAILDKNGQLLLSGAKQGAWSDPSSGAGNWLVKLSGAVKSWLGLAGNLYLRGSLSAEQPSISSAGPALFFREKAGQTYVGKIDGSGNMYIKGQLGEGCSLP